MDNKDKISTVFFQVTHPNSSKTSYLFGSHHAFGKPFFDSLTLANQVLDSSNVLIKENLNVPGELAQDIINQRKEKTNWKNYLNSEDLAYIEKLFANSPTDFNKMTPQELFVFLSRYGKQQICLNKQATDTSLSLDNYVETLAIQKGIQLIGLETTMQQIEYINQDVEGMPKKVHKRRLRNLIQQIQSKNKSLCQETTWYSNMDFDYQLNNKCSNTLMLTHRNEQWMTELPDLIENNNAFIIVGLSHLMYDCGLINQLRQQGFIITPLSMLEASNSSRN